MGEKLGGLPEATWPDPAAKLRPPRASLGHPRVACFHRCSRCSVHGQGQPKALALSCLEQWPGRWGRAQASSQREAITSGLETRSPPETPPALSHEMVRERRAGSLRRLRAYCPASGSPRGMIPEGTQEVPRIGGRKQQLACSRFTLDSLHVQALMLTDVRIPFLRTPLVPL